MALNPWTFEPDGWIHEDGDPEVGIFGDAWYHDDCPNPSTPDDYEEAELYPVDEIRLGSMTIATHYRLACLDCGEVIDLVQEDFSPDEEWWAENTEAQIDAIRDEEQNALDSFDYDSIGS